MKAIDKTYPLFQYPGNVIIVDDDARFTKALSLKLADSFTTTVFNSPSNAIKFFMNRSHSIFDELSLIAELPAVELDTDGFAYTIDYEAISKLIGFQPRYQEPTVLIVDYRMPDMTGLEFLSKINNKHIKTILLTAHDEKSIAVNAFNSGLIDKYIIKDPSIIDSNLFSVITELNQAYFNEVSKDKLGIDLLTRLYDAQYNKIFAEWIRNFNINEYYRIDDCGSVVGLTASGKVIWLALQAQNKQASYTDVFNSHHDKPLGNAQMIYLFSDKEKYSNPTALDSYVYDIQGHVTVRGIPMCYTIIQDETFSLSIAHLTSFTH
ncbi:MAG: response regulator [Gammaproteobacteria bacterium]|nr:response regulator [Gammaproteobacteria bacterium]